MIIGRRPILFCVLVALLAGCKTAPPTDFEFDRHGWGGPDPQYTRRPESDGLELKPGVVFKQEFRWQDSTFSLEFLDKPDQVWGVVLTDFTFRGKRRRALDKTVIRTPGPKQFYLGRELGIDQLWPKYRVAELTLRRGGEGRPYKILDCWWHHDVIDGKQNVRLTTTHDLRVRPNKWNELTVAVRRGRLTYTLNGRPCGEARALQIDPEANGRVGFFVYKNDGPLMLRNLRFGSGAPAE
ncbi:MAG: hypothetical protein R6V58_10590 [Planctomycetota bacterium]